ncbi:hypothetical protein V1523DRAFT_446880 [Lipomyces doorenjongii]
MTAKTELKVGVAGAGRVGSVHIENVIETSGLELVAIFEDFDEFIRAAFDLVIICTPTQFHKEHVEKALKTGKHVFCEKPLGPDAKTAWDIYDIALQYSTQKVACGFPRRFADVFQEAAARIKSGDIGKVMSVRSQSVDPYEPSEFFTNYIKNSGGIFVDMNIHDIDVCLYLMGGDETPVTAYATGTANMFPQFAEFGDVDDVFGLVTFESGKVMALYGNRDSMQGHHASAEIAGTKGRITANGSPRFLDLLITDPSGSKTLGAKSHMDLFQAAFKKEIRDMRDWVLYEKEAAFNLKDAAKAVSIASALMDSLRNGEAVKVIY